MALHRIDTGSSSPRCAGVEHEYRVSSSGRQVDFRGVIHGLQVEGKRIDPGDTHAYRTASGLKITCDGPEAEIATPPVSLRGGFVNELVRWTGAGRQCLAEICGDVLDIDGVSTHLSVAIDNRIASRAAGMFTRTFAPALMLLMDAETSPGLLVRPRYGRLEMGGEFVAGGQLAAAIALAVGGALVCERAAASFRAKSALPPPVRVDVVRAVDRYGWYVARDAFGMDLYAAGRDAKLRRELVGSMRAQDCLEEAWKSARRALSGIVDEGDLRPADDVVSGRSEIPLESGLRHASPGVTAAPTRSPFGLAMVDFDTPVLSLSAAVATWDYVVFRVQGPREVYLSVPREELGAFIDDAVRGRYDERIESFGLLPGQGRVLSRFDDAAVFGLWDAVAFTEALAPPERGVAGV